MQLLDHSLVDFDSPQDIQDCVIKAQGGIMSTKALPGNYAVAFVDPTGVVDYRLVRGRMTVTGEEVAVKDFGGPIRERAFRGLQYEMYFAHTHDQALCGEEPCEAGTFDIMAELTLVRVWTDDDEQWNAEAEQGDQTFTGTLERSSDGELLFNLETTS